MQDSHVAVITGGTGALGRATVPLLIRRGFRIAATYLIPEEARAFEDEFEVDDERLRLRRVDCTDPGAVGTFMQETIETFGPINVLCSLVGGWAGGRYVEETDDVRFDRMIDLNLRATFYTVRAAIPHMREVDWGRVIVVSSRTALDPPAGQGAFDVAKAGDDLMEAGDLEGALGYFRRYVEAAPEDPNAHDSYGEGLLRAGRRVDQERAPGRGQVQRAAQVHPHE